MERQHFTLCLENRSFRHLALFVVLFCVVGCRDRSVSINQFEKKGDTSINVVGFLNRDTIVLERTYYLKKIIFKNELYDSLGLLKKRVTYQANGDLEEVTNYRNGYRHGAHLLYDSDNSLRYYDYYYYGKILGPVITYEGSSTPKEFSFVSFENKELIHIDYSKWNGIPSIMSTLLNYTITFIEEDDVKKHNLFIYLPVIPKVDLKYELYETNKTGTESRFIRELKSSQPFLETTLDAISKDHFFEIRVTAINQLTSDTTIIRDF